AFGTTLAQTNEWTSIGPEGGPIVTLSMDPRNTATIYGAGRHVYKSVDGGANWIDAGAPSKFLVFDPQDPLITYALDSLYGGFTCDGILKSTDGGASWNAANTGLLTQGPSCSPVFSLVIDPENSLTLYAGTWKGVYKSIDGGATWNPASSGLPKG